MRPSGNGVSRVIGSTAATSASFWFPAFADEGFGAAGFTTAGLPADSQRAIPSPTLGSHRSHRTSSSEKIPRLSLVARARCDGRRSNTRDNLGIFSDEEVLW